MALAAVALAAVALEVLRSGKGRKVSPLSVIVRTIGVEEREEVEAVAEEVVVVAAVTAARAAADEAERRDVEKGKREEEETSAGGPSSIAHPRSAASSRLSSRVPERRAMPAVGLIRSVVLETSTALLSTAAAGTVRRTSSAYRMSYDASCETVITASAESITVSARAPSTPALAVSQPAG